MRLPLTEGGVSSTKRELLFPSPASVSSYLPTVDMRVLSTKPHSATIGRQSRRNYGRAFNEEISVNLERRLNSHVQDFSRVGVSTVSGLAPIQKISVVDSDQL